jgi:hypothetical protein
MQSVCSVGGWKLFPRACFRTESDPAPRQRIESPHAALRQMPQPSSASLYIQLPIIICIWSSCVPPMCGKSILVGKQPGLSKFDPSGRADSTNRLSRLGRKGGWFPGSSLPAPPWFHRKGSSLGCCGGALGIIRNAASSRSSHNPGHCGRECALAPSSPSGSPHALRHQADMRLAAAVRRRPTVR